MAVDQAQQRVIGGLCARWAERHHLNPVAVRTLTVALALATVGVAALVYIVLWFSIPHTTAYAASEGDGPSVEPATATTAAEAADSRAPALRVLYGPVGDDLPRVDEMLTALADVEHPWLREMLAATLGGGGKRLRPAIALLSGRFGAYDLDRLVPLAASVELLHTATLVHDDVIDAAAERRGRPTTAALFNNGPAVMLGDYMFAHAAEFVARTGNVRVIRNFAATLGVMARGELTQDMSAFEYSEDVQRYLDRIFGKTASLFATAAEGGAIVCEAPEPCVEPLRRYGETLGMAFQIVDDILDFSGDAELMGKPVGSDLMAGTLTLPSLLYMQRNPDNNAVKRAFGGLRRRSNLARAIKEIRSSDILDESMQTARHFAGLARAALTELPPGDARDTLDGLVDYVLERQS